MIKRAFWQSYAVGGSVTRLSQRLRWLPRLQFVVSSSLKRTRTTIRMSLLPVLIPGLRQSAESSQRFLKRVNGSTKWKWLRSPESSERAWKMLARQRHQLLPLGCLPISQTLDVCLRTSSLSLWRKDEKGGPSGVAF